MTASETPLLVFGRGWLGHQWADRVDDAFLTGVDIADAEAVAREMDRLSPAAVVNAAGKTGIGSVDSLEGEAASTYRSNVIGPIVLAAACEQRGIHFAHLSSGCVYSGDKGGVGFGEDDPPNFSGSLYSRTKAVAEAALRDFDVLQLRIRLPIASVPHPRNLLTKILGYPRVLRVGNSITVLDDAWPTMLELARREETGVWNIVNDELEYHDDLLGLWRERVDLNHDFEVVEEAALGMKAGRSNCRLSTAKLHDTGLALPPLSESLPKLVDAYARHLRE